MFDLINSASPPESPKDGHPAASAATAGPDAAAALGEERAGKDLKKKESLLSRFKYAATKTLKGSAGVYPPRSASQEDLPAGEHEPSPSAGFLFGVSLEIVAGLGPPLMSSIYGVPAFIHSAITYLQDHEAATEGIFRLSGSLSTIKSYKKILDSGGQICWEPGKDAHNATGLIKMYLRELPTPLLTFPLFPAFCSTLKCQDAEARTRLLQSLLTSLPLANYNLLKFLLTALKGLSQHEEHTKMGITNLATLIGPNIGWDSTPTNDQHEMFLSTSYAAAIAAHFLHNMAALFDQERRPHHLAVAMATFDYEAREEGDLGLCAGTLVFVTDANDRDGWWEGETVDSKGALSRGRFPFNYIQTVAQAEEGLARLRSIIDLELGEEGSFSKEYQDVYKDTHKDVQRHPNGIDDDKTEDEPRRHPEQQKEHGDIAPEIKQAASDEINTDLEDDGVEGEWRPLFPAEPGENFGQEIDMGVEQLHIDRSSSTPSPTSAIDRLEILNEKLVQLEIEISTLKVELAEERIQRQQLGEIIPHLMRNQDEVLTLLHSLNRS